MHHRPPSRQVVGGIRCHGRLFHPSSTFIYLQVHINMSVLWYMICRVPSPHRASMHCSALQTLLVVSLCGHTASTPSCSYSIDGVAEDDCVADGQFRAQTKDFCCYDSGGGIRETIADYCWQRCPPCTKKAKGASRSGCHRWLQRARVDPPVWQCMQMV